MKLTDNDLDWTLNNKKLPEIIKEKMKLEYERNKVNELLDNEKKAFNMCSIKEILEILINNETAIRDVSEYIFQEIILVDLERMNLEGNSKTINHLDILLYLQ